MVSKAVRMVFRVIRLKSILPQFVNSMVLSKLNCLRHRFLLWVNKK